MIQRKAKAPGRNTRSSSLDGAGAVDFRALANSLPALVFVCDPTGACIFTNTRVQQFTGLGADAWLGDSWLDGIHPDDRDLAARAWSGAVAASEPYEVEYRLRSAEGHHVWHLARATPVREKGRIMRWVGHATDIDDAKRASAAQAAALTTAARQSDGERREAEEFAARLIEATPDSITTLSLDGHVLSVNSAGAAALDVPSSSALLGRDWIETWRSTGYHLAAKQAVEMAADGAIGRFVGCRRNEAGLEQWWNVIITPMRDRNGAPDRLLCVSRDVTDVKAASERFRLIAETVSEVFYHTDLRSQSLLYVSPAYATLWGRSVQEVEADPKTLLEAIHVEDRPRVLDALERQRQGESTRCEYRVIRPDGDVRHVRDLAYPVFDAKGRPAKVVGAVEDITEVVKAQARAAAADEARYRGVFEHATVGIARVALDGRFLEVNGRFTEMLGYRREDLLAGGFQQITHPDDLEADLANVEALLTGRAESYSMEKRYITCEGAILRANLTVGIVHAPEGGADHFVAVVQPLPDKTRSMEDEAEIRTLKANEQDVAFRLELADALRDLDDPVAMIEAATERLGRHLGVAQVGFAEVDEAGDHITVHRDWSDGRVPSVVGTWRMDDFGPRFVQEMRSGATIIIPDVTEDPLTNAPEVLAAYAGIGTRAILDRPLLRDGRTTSILFLHHHEPRIWTLADVALAEEVAERLWSAVEQARAERQLAESEARARDRLAELDQVYRHAPLGLFALDREYRFTRVNERMAEIDGLPPGDHIGRNIWEIVPDLADHLVEVYRPVLERGEAVLDVDLHGETPASPGLRRDWRANYFPLRSGLGGIAGLIGVVVEVTDRTQADARLAESEARFHAITDAMPQIVWSTRPDGHHDFYNARWYEFTGVPAGSTDGEGWNAIFHPDDQAEAWARWNRSLTTGEPYEIEYRLRHRDGTYRWVLGRALPVRDEAGRIIRWMGTCTDIHEIVETRRALAESRIEVERARADLEARVAARTAALGETARSLMAEMKRREEAQGQLLQAQKMEALGQLVGGVPHDFNNILAAIQGAFALLDRKVEDARLSTIIDQGRKAGERAAALVRQMLAFARREELAPKVVNPAELIGDLEGMVRHTVGARITCRFDLADGTWPVLVDPHQLEVVLLNLAINARDAMAGEGQLRVGLRNLGAEEPRPSTLDAGDYVVLSVEDTGCGMDKGTMARVFEPFLTTKPMGQGTGLGLVQVQGFAKAVGGAVEVASELRQGTTMSVYLPRSAMAAAGPAAAPVVSPSLHGGASLLLVDEDEQVRQVLAAYLRDLGYRVIEAAGAGTAVALAQIHAIDLVLTDIVMPGQDGVTLARQLREERPHLPVLFMTGHAGNQRVKDDMVITKPFAGQHLELGLLRLLGRLDIHTAERLAMEPRSQRRLLARLQDPNHREAYERWQEALGQRRLPDLAGFDWAGLNTSVMLRLRPEPGEGSLGFRVLSMGAALAARLGAPLEGQLLAADGPEMLGSMDEAYRRGLATLAPTYDWARLRLDDGMIRFERLILPFSDDGAHISDLVVLIRFDDVP